MCAYPKVLEQPAATHGELRLPSNWEHNNRRHFVRIVPPVPGCWNALVHAPCVCNEIVCTSNRVIGKVPLPTRHGVAELKYQAKRLAEKCGHQQPWELERVVESFTGSRKRRYEEAYQSILLKPLDAGDARIQSFVKAEKMDPAAKPNPDPRPIQARSPRYNLKIAQYLRPVEHCIYNIKGKDGMREVAKGLNQADRADLIKRKMAMFKRPVVFSIDCSRWDKHVSLDVLRVEHAFYKRVVPGQPEFERLLSWQEVNRCRTAGGIRYVVNGGRMSGDINTALGNCLLMVLMVRAAMKRMGIKLYSILDDGDDCLVFVEEEDFDRLSKELQKVFLDYGQELKIENVARDYRDVVFCQSRIVFNGKIDVMIRDWRKVLSHACCGTRHWNDPNLVRPMMGLVGSCELALNLGVPILQSFSQALIRMSKGLMASFKNMDTGLMYRLKAEFGQDHPQEIKEVAPVCEEARASFERTYGVERWRQLAIEDILRRWDLDSTIAQTFPVEWDHRWEDNTSLYVQLPQIF